MSRSVSNDTGDDNELASKKNSPASFLRRLLARKSGPIALACALATIASLLNLAAFWLLYLLTAELLVASPDSGRLMLISVGFPLLALLWLLVLGGSSITAHATAFSVTRKLRVSLLKSLNRQNLGQIEGQTAALKKSVVDYPSEIEHFIAHTLPDAVSGLATLLFGAALLFYVDWRMAIVSLALLPIAIASQFWAYRIFGRITEAWFAADQQVTAALLSYARGITTLKAFNRTASSLHDVREAVDTLMNLSRTGMTASSVPFAMFFTVVSGNLVFVAPVGLFLLSRGEIGIAEFVLFLTLGAQVAAPLMKLLFASGGLQRLSVASKCISQLLDAPTTAPPAIARVPDRMDIKFENVCFGYDQSKDVLHNVSLALPEHQVSAIVGPSGAGKSTLIRLIARYWDVGSGTLKIGGVDIRDIPTDELRRCVSVVFQDPFFFHGTVRENLSIAAPSCTSQDLDRAISASGLEDLVRHLPNGLETSLGDRGTRLSSGERQRLAIARALLKDAPILLLDEATAFADPENELSIQRAIARLTIGRTVVVVAHRLATTQSADVIAVMNEGAVEANGNHKSLLRRSPVYRELWTSQQRAMKWFLAPAHEAAC